VAVAAGNPSARHEAAALSPSQLAGPLRIEALAAFADARLEMRTLRGRAAQPAIRSLRLGVTD
jgi:hypothetical protein